jgi:hypothetical protein
MPFCPKCRCEYRPGFTKCSDCEVDLVDVLPPEPKPGELDKTTFVPVRAYPSRILAEMVQEALSNEGIPSIIRGSEVFGTGTGLMEPVAPKLTLCVPDTQLEEAGLIADGIVDPI